MIRKNVNVLIFSSPPFGVRDQKIYGVHRIASEIRKHGFTCQIVHYFTSFTKKELEKILKKLVGTKTLAVGFSSTFWSWTDFENERKTIDHADHVINEIKKINPKIKIIGGGPGILELCGSVIGKKISRKKFLKLDACNENFTSLLLEKYKKNFLKK